MFESWCFPDQVYCVLFICFPLLPRPDWDKCADHVNGGMNRWKELTTGKTSNEMVEVLLSEMASGEIVDVGGAEYFDGQVYTFRSSLNCLQYVTFRCHRLI